MRKKNALCALFRKWSKNCFLNDFEIVILLAIAGTVRPPLFTVEVWGDPLEALDFQIFEKKKSVKDPHVGEARKA